MMMNGPGMMIWGVVSFLVGLIILLLFVVAAAYAVKWMSGQGSERPVGREERALDVLKKRYARGEIGKEEFDRVKKEIE
jgi:putative membrane protein